MVTVEFEGVVTSTEDQLSLLPTLQVGTAFSGAYSYEDAATSEPCGPGCRVYDSSTQPSAGVAFEVGYVARRNPSEQRLVINPVTGLPELVEVGLQTSEVGGTITSLRIVPEPAARALLGVGVWGALALRCRGRDCGSDPAYHRRE